MASRIQGITIEIGTDTTKLESALKSVNSIIKTTQSELKDVDKLLKLDPANTELLAQKQKALQDAISATKDKLETLKTAQEQAKSAFESGELGADKYNALQREIVATEQELKNLQSEAQNAHAALEKISGAGEKLQSIGAGITDVGKKLTSTVTVPIVAVGTAGVKSFAEVDKTVQLTNKTMGNTEEEAELLNEEMKSAAANSTFGTEIIVFPEQICPSNRISCRVDQFFLLVVKLAIICCINQIGLRFERSDRYMCIRPQLISDRS